MAACAVASALVPQLLGVSIATTVAEIPDVANGCAGSAKKPYEGHPNPDLLFLS